MKKTIRVKYCLDISVYFHAKSPIIEKNSRTGGNYYMKHENIRNKEINLLGLFGREKLEQLEKRLGEATDFSVSIIDYRGGEVVPAYHQNAYEDFLRHHEEPSCQMSAAFSAAKAAITNLPYIYLCQCGLVKATIPMVVNEQYIGAIICGYIRCDDVEEKDPVTQNQIVQKDFPLGHEAEKDEYLNNMPSFSAQKIQDVAGLAFYLVREMCSREEYSIRLSKEEHNHIHLQEMRKKNGELSEIIRNLEMDSMKKNLYPQALINILITVSNLSIIEEAPMTRNIIESFSSVLRYYIGHGGENVSMNKEIVQIEKYLNTLKVQYENRFDLTVSREGIRKEQKIPKMVLFLLVEYMINTTVQRSGYQGHFSLDVRYISGRCVATIRYDCEHADRTAADTLTDLLEDKEFIDQVPYIERRLKHEYGDDYKLSIEPDLIRLDIPKAFSAE